MTDLDKDGKGEQPKPPVEATPATSVQTTKKPVEPPVSQVKGGFNYNRGNFDTSVITLLATMNSNIVANTEILKKAIEGKNERPGK